MKINNHYLDRRICADLTETLPAPKLVQTDLKQIVAKTVKDNI
jgi:hypothetical protein